jgi:hypothetical protein
VACEHKRLKSVNCVLYCMDCGEKIEQRPEPKEPEKKPAKRTAKKDEQK